LRARRGFKGVGPLAKLNARSHVSLRGRPGFKGVVPRALFIAQFLLKIG
jgi:hypothetical protein